MRDGFSEFKGISTEATDIDDRLAELFGYFFSLTQDWQHALDIGLNQCDVSEIFGINQVLLNQFFSGFKKENSVGKWTAQWIVSCGLKCGWIGL